MELMAHVIVLGLLLFLLIISWIPNSSFFSWHPTLMATGLLFLYTESILLFHPKFSPVNDHKLRVKLHQILQIAGYLIAAVGMYCIYSVKESAGKPHISTWHAFFGVVTMCVGGFQVFVGNMLIYPKMRSIMRISESLGELKKKHAKGGLLTISCAMFTIGLAFYSTWFQKKEFHKIYQNVGVGAVFAIVGILGAQVYQRRLSTA